MNLRTLSIILSATIITLVSCDAQKDSSKAVSLSSEVDSASYALGVSFGSQIKGQFKDINLDALASGINDAYDDSTKISLQQARPILQAYAQKLKQKAAEENKKKAEDFLAENAKKEGVEVTESGMQYKVIEAGSGPKPTESDTVKVHYHGTLIDGTVFDSSKDRGKPVTFGVTKVIDGWTEALQMMSVGAKWEIYLPPSLGYGQRGAGQDIGPNSALIFEIELLGIE